MFGAILETKSANQSVSACHEEWTHWVRPQWFVSQSSRSTRPHASPHLRCAPAPLALLACLEKIAAILQFLARIQFKCCGINSNFSCQILSLDPLNQKLFCSKVSFAQGWGVSACSELLGYSTSKGAFIVLAGQVKPVGGLKHQMLLPLLLLLLLVLQLNLAVAYGPVCETHRSWSCRLLFPLLLELSMAAWLLGACAMIDHTRHRRPAIGVICKPYPSVKFLYCLWPSRS